MTHPAYVQCDEAALGALVRDHPLASIVTCSEDRMWCTHAPLLITSLDDQDQTWVIQGHLSRANPHVDAILREGGCVQALLIFRGPQGYVSANYFPEKAKTHRVVPTWDYTTVECRGTLRLVDDPSWTLDLVSRLSATEEQHNRERHSPALPAWSVDEAPRDYIASQVRRVVGIEVRVAERFGRFKLSQANAGEAAGAAAGVYDRGDTALGDAIVSAAGLPPCPLRHHHGDWLTAQPWLAIAGFSAVVGFMVVWLRASKLRG